jgi:hypothetical protein
MADKAHNKIISDAFMDAVGLAVGVPIGHARRIIIDATVGQALRVYVEFIGDTRMFDLELPTVAIEDIIMARLEGEKGG